MLLKTSFHSENGCDVTTCLSIHAGISTAGVEFRRELRESIWILLGGVCKSLDSPVFSLCETSDSLRESNWTLLDSFAGVFARVDYPTLAEILTLQLCLL